MIRYRAKTMHFVVTGLSLGGELFSTGHRHLCNPFTLNVYLIVMLENSFSIGGIEKAETYAGFPVVEKVNMPDAKLIRRILH
ncbi:MAG: hypothetical protein WAL66_16720 [Nitrososphaeraceae archaeon]